MPAHDVLKKQSSDSSGGRTPKEKGSTFGMFDVFKSKASRESPKVLAGFKMKPVEIFRSGSQTLFSVNFSHQKIGLGTRLYFLHQKIGLGTRLYPDGLLLITSLINPATVKVEKCFCHIGDFNKYNGTFSQLSHRTVAFIWWMYQLK